MTTLKTRADAPARKVGSALVAQAKLTAAWLVRTSPTAFARPVTLGNRPVMLGNWDVRALTGHLVQMISSTTEALNRPTTTRPVTLDAHMRTRRHSITRIDAEMRRTIGNDGGPTLARQLQAQISDLQYTLSGELPSAVELHLEAVRPLDLLRTVLIEFVVHSNDLSHAVGDEVPVPLDPQAVIEVARVYAELLGRAWPGRTLEVRVPPATAVQVAALDGGSTHTRGTPPNVIEMDPHTWIDLASGRLTWERAIENRRVSRSGAHTNLGPLLAPLTSPL